MRVEAESPQPRAVGRSARRLLGSPSGRIAAVAAAAAVAGAVALGSHVADESPVAAARQQPVRAAPISVSEKGLSTFAGTLGHPLYWAGPAEGETYELTSTADGRAYIRYLPAGTRVGDARSPFRTIGTYPQPDAFATLEATAKAQGVSTVPVAGGGLAFQDVRRPTSAYLAYPGSDVQIEVYDGAPGRALKLVTDGRISPVVAPPPTGGAAPRVASVGQLAALRAEIGHPVYWLGATAGTTYEVTRTADDRVYVRYLPKGVQVGDERPSYVTVGTYPQAGALAALKAGASSAGAMTFPVRGGGTAYVDGKRPTSVYVAFPGADVQVEVFAPDSARARDLVASGALAAVR
jgi:hypothetical protein